MVIGKLYDYEGLIEKFLNHEITVQEFERTYIDIFSNDNTPKSEDLFLELDWLFAEVDYYTDVEEALRDFPEDYITEEQLRESAAKTLAEIRELKKQGRLLP